MSLKFTVEKVLKDEAGVNRARAATLILPGHDGIRIGFGGGDGHAGDVLGDID